MGQHYTRNTVSVQKFCKRCHKITPHRVDDRRLGSACLECINGPAAPEPAAKADSILIDQPCICAQYRFPHYHQSRSDKIAAQQQFGYRRLRYDKEQHAWI